MTVSQPTLGRPPTYPFFRTLQVGQAEIVPTAGLSVRERFRLLRSLRSIASQHKTYSGLAFRAVFVADGIKVERIA